MALNDGRITSTKATAREIREALGVSEAEQAMARRVLADRPTGSTIGPAEGDDLASEEIYGVPI